MHGWDDSDEEPPSKATKKDGSAQDKADLMKVCEQLATMQAENKALRKDNSQWKEEGEKRLREVEKKQDQQKEDLRNTNKQVRRTYEKVQHLERRQDCSDAQLFAISKEKLRADRLEARKHVLIDWGRGAKKQVMGERIRDDTLKWLLEDIRKRHGRELKPKISHHLPSKNQNKLSEKTKLSFEEVADADLFKKSFLEYKGGIWSWDETDTVQSRRLWMEPVQAPYDKMKDIPLMVAEYCCVHQIVADSCQGKEEALKKATEMFDTEYTTRVQEQRINRKAPQHVICSLVVFTNSKDSRCHIPWRAHIDTRTETPHKIKSLTFQTYLHVQQTKHIMYTSIEPNFKDADQLHLAQNKRKPAHKNRTLNKPANTDKREPMFISIQKQRRRSLTKTNTCKQLQPSPRETIHATTCVPTDIYKNFAHSQRTQSRTQCMH